MKKPGHIVKLVIYLRSVDYVGFEFVCVLEVLLVRNFQANSRESWNRRMIINHVSSMGNQLIIDIVRRSFREQPECIICSRGPVLLRATESFVYT